MDGTRDGYVSIFFYNPTYQMSDRTQPIAWLGSLVGSSICF